MFVMMGFTTLLFFVLMLVATIISRMIGMKRSKEKAFVNSVILRNQGNFGIPLITLAFAGVHGEYALSLHIIVMLATNMLLNTFGLYNASSGSYTPKDAMKNILKLPMLYTMAIAFFLRGFNIGLPNFVLETTNIMGRGMVAVALLTLGVQLASTKVNFKDLTIYMSNFLRLAVSPPLIAWGGLVELLSIEA